MHLRRDIRALLVLLYYFRFDAFQAVPELCFRARSNAYVPTGKINAVQAMLVKNPLSPACGCSKAIHKACQLHSTTLALPALLHITLLFLLPQRHTLPSLHPFNGYILLALSVCPSQSLSHSAIHVVHADGPLAAADFHGGVVAWEMELRQEDLRRYSFSGSSFTFK